MLPAVLHNLTRMYFLMSEKNNITVTVLEYNLPLNILHFHVVTKIKIMRPIIITVNAAIVCHCATHFCCSFPLPNIDYVYFLGWKVMPVINAFNLHAYKNVNNCCCSYHG